MVNIEIVSHIGTLYWLKSNYELGDHIYEQQTNVVFLNIWILVLLDPDLEPFSSRRQIAVADSQAALAGPCSLDKEPLVSR